MDAQKEVEAEISEKISIARSAHPVFAMSGEHAIKVVKSEMLEWYSQASLIYVQGEAIIVLLSWICEEYRER